MPNNNLSLFLFAAKVHKWIRHAIRLPSLLKNTEREPDVTSFSATPEIQFQRYEYHFRFQCSEIKWTDSSTRKAVGFFFYISNSIPLQFNFALFPQDNPLTSKTL